MQNTLYTQTPAALPMEYSIDAVAASPDWIYELRWRSAPLDTFYDIGSAVEAGLSHASFVAGGYFEDDCASGDMHGPCAPLEWFASYCEASGYGFANYMDSAEAIGCPVCDGFHLVLERPRAAAEEFGVD